MSTETTTVVERIKLGYTGMNGSRFSDKIYILELIKVGTRGYIVTGWNGARSAQNLTKQEKITTPVSYTSAKQEFTRVLNTKLYHPRTPYEIESQTSEPTTSAASAPPPTVVKASQSNKPTRTKEKADPPPPSHKEKRNDPLSYLDALEI